MATVDAPASVWYIPFDLSVGCFGHGTLSITNSAEVVGGHGNGYVGNQTGSIGAVTVDGTNSKWTNSGDLFVGYAGMGTLNVSDGGTAQATTVVIGPLGEIHGNGFIVGNLQNSGLVSPGNSPAP